MHLVRWLRGRQNQTVGPSWTLGEVRLLDDDGADDEPDVHTHVISDFGADDESDAKPDVRTHVISDFGILVHIAW